MPRDLSVIAYAVTMAQNFTAVGVNHKVENGFRGTKIIYYRIQLAVNL